MDTKTIRELAEILKDANLTALELEEGETRIRLERSLAPVVAAPMPEAPIVAAPQQLQSVDPGDPGMDFNDISVVNSPMVGVFYAAPAPDQSPYVTVGDHVKKGDVLCIVEAMKLMNEILAEEDGQIIDICVSDGDIVEFGQTLFKLV